MVDLVRFGGGVDAARFPGSDHLAHDAAIVGDPQFAVFDAQCRAADQHVVGPVPEEDAGPIGTQQPRGGLGHLHQQGLDLLGPVPLVGDFQDGLQPADATPVVVTQPDGGEGLAQDRSQVLDYRQGVGRLVAVDRKHFAPGAAGGQRRGDPFGLRAGGVPVEHVGQ